MRWHSVFILCRSYFISTIVCHLFAHSVWIKNLILKNLYLHQKGPLFISFYSYCAHFCRFLMWLTNRLIYSLYTFFICDFINSHSVYCYNFTHHMTIPSHVLFGQFLLIFDKGLFTISKRYQWIDSNWIHWA